MSDLLQPSRVDLRPISNNCGNIHHPLPRVVGSWHSSWMRWLACLLLCGSWMASPCLLTVEAQSKSSKKSSKAEETEADSGLEEASFGVVSATDPEGGPADEVDETEEGRQRVAELIGRAREIFRERDQVEKTRRPLAGPRDILQGEINQLNQNVLAANQAISRGQAQLRNLERQAKLNGNENGAIDQIRDVQFSIGQAQTAIRFSQSEIAKRVPELDAFNAQIKPLDERLRKLWEELNNSRKQWLELRQPQKKYAYGNFELMKKVLDDWLLIDGLWPEAFCWAALCAYELGNYESAWEYVDKAAEIRRILNFPKAWPQGEALRGLIAAKVPSRRGKSAGYLQSALVYANKNKKSDWQTYFLVGRAAVESDKAAPKAKANFEKALKINSDVACVKFWYGRLQTTSTVDTVRDVKEGTNRLEAMWLKSTKKSWRLSHALVLAYDAAKRDADATKAWEVTLELAPRSEHSNLIALREEATKKLQSIDSDDEAPAKKTKSSSKS